MAEGPQKPSANVRMFACLQPVRDWLCRLTRLYAQRIRKSRAGYCRTLKYCNLGHSFFTGDNDASATYNEVRIWNAALSESQLTANAIAGPDVVPDVRANLVSTRTYVVSAGATLDLNGGLLACGDLSGAGTVKGGFILACGKVDAALTLEDVSLCGETQIVSDGSAVPDGAFWADHPALLKAAGGDAEAAAKMQSPGKTGAGKFKANGEPMYVWEDFVAGTNPEDETDLFRAEITLDADGKPHVKWHPALNGIDKTTGECIRDDVRTYRVWGRSDLSGDGTWVDTELTPGDYKFFKVTVEMP